MAAALGFFSFAAAAAAAASACTGDNPAFVTATDGGAAEGSAPSDAATEDATKEDAGADAAVDAARCDPGKPFEAPTPLAWLATDAGEQAITMSSDELVAVVEIDRNLLYTSRASRNDPFPKPNFDKVVALNTADYEGQPSLSADGKTLYFTRIGADYDLRVATRPSVTESFGNEKAVMIDGAPGKGEFPRINRVGNRLTFVEPDLHEQTFIADRAGDNVTFVTKRSLAGALEFPVLSGDDRTLYFTETSPARALRYATRPQPGDPLGARKDMPVAVRAFDAVHVTDDDCILYLVGPGPTGTDVFESRRGR